MSDEPDVTEYRCPSCGRSNLPGDNFTETFTYIDQLWCGHCAKAEEIQGDLKVVLLPSPGAMISGQFDDFLNAWIDCYDMRPKKRILVRNARLEIQRAWADWDGDKSSNLAMFTFFAWLTRHRPYFLTFRGRGDPWQKVHSWLIQFERSVTTNPGE